MLRMFSRVMLLMALSCLDLPHYMTSTEVSHCSSSHNMKFTIQTSRNRTGHWSSKVSVGNAESFAVSSADGVLRKHHWKVELNHDKDGCDGSETFVATMELSPPRAGPGYELFEGVGYYKFHTEPRTWLEGLKICEQEGAHLAIINSEREAAVLKQLFDRHPKIPGAENDADAAIGFHDRYVEGQYLTIYDEPLASTGFVRWSKIYDQPNNFDGSDTNPGEDCGGILRDGGLNDLKCHFKIAFICEQEL